MAPEDSMPQSEDDAESDLRPEDAEAELRPDDPAEQFEPDVPDPVADLAPDAPAVPDETDADPELRRQFWSLVLLFNVALFGMALGAMLVGFEGRWRVGGAVFAAGAVAFARGWRGYRRATSDATNGSASADD